MSLVSTLRFIMKHPLSRGRHLQNVSRFATWQVRSRLASKPIVFDFANGTRMYARHGMTGVTGNIYVGLHDFEDMALLLHFLRPGELFVDVGANVGSYSILAAAAVGADVIAFEPGKEARAWLNRNIELNRVGDRVDVRDHAVGSRSGTTCFTKGLDTVNHLVLDGAVDTEAIETVEMVTLDDALDDRSAVMLKVDVEGFETEVLRGAAATLANPALQCVVLELGGTGANYGYDEDGIRDGMQRLGFTQCGYDPYTRSLTTRDTSGTQGNTLFVRDKAYVADRLGTAKAFLILNRSI
ncbi:MAG: FkbM family methyltransferase [Bauldia sp.]